LKKAIFFNRNGQFGNSILHKSKEGLAQGPKGAIKFNNRDFAFFASSSTESCYRSNESSGTCKHVAKSTNSLQSNFTYFHITSWYSSHHTDMGWYLMKKANKVTQNKKIQENLAKEEISTNSKNINNFA
jgi:hypothetical protein